MTCIEQIKQLLAGDYFRPVTYGRGATSIEIVRAEKEMGLRFPGSYTDFLSKVGWIDSPLINVSGFGVDVDFRTDLMASTRSWWYEVDIEIRLPRHFVPVVEDGAGNAYCLDISRMAGSECPVVFWDHESFEEADQIPNLVGTDFYSWLIYEINELSS